MSAVQIVGAALILFIGCASIVVGEFYSSVDNLQALVDVELEMLAATRKYLVEQRQQLETYRNFIQRVKREHEQAVLDLDEYVGHPLRAFQLLKRMVYDWNELHGLISENRLASVINDKLTELTEQYGYPDQKELRGAINGLARLQEVYDLKAVDITDGMLNGYNTDSQLDWKECYEIGALLFDDQKYKLAVEWLQIAINLLIQQPNSVTSENQAHIAEIHEYLALAEFELGNENNAGEFMDKTTALNSSYSAELTRAYLDQSIAPEPSEPSRADWFQNYTRLCQGQRVPEPKHNQLRCFLDSRRHAVFTLAPLKVEEVHQDPDIHIYHGLLSNEKIDAIFEEVDNSEIFRSMINNLEVDERRVSQQTWLNYSTPIIHRVRSLVEDVSGLDLSEADEEMQVVNYGIGGHYEPHHDYSSDVPEELHGKRYSTSMFYLSNVEQGGYTVFPQLNVFLPPIKGAMVMWYNLHRSLEPDTRTLHAGCPVIVGSKRIANIWVQSSHQELRRPCALHLDKS